MLKVRSTYIRGSTYQSMAVKSFNMLSFEMKAIDNPNIFKKTFAEGVFLLGWRVYNTKVSNYYICNTDELDYRYIGISDYIGCLVH